MTSANCGQSDEIDGIGQKTGPFLGRDEHNDSFSQEKAPFSGRKGSKEKRDTPKGCLRKYLAMRFLSYARNDIDQITC